MTRPSTPTARARGLLLAALVALPASVLLSGCLDDTGQARPPACPGDLRVVERGAGEIVLAWNATQNATWEVHRSTGDVFERVAEVDDTRYVDDDVQAEASYRYHVAPAAADVEPTDCAIVEAAAVPVLEDPRSVLAAAAAATLAIGLLARRGSR